MSLLRPENENLRALYVYVFFIVLTSTIGLMMGTPFITVCKIWGLINAFFIVAGVVAFVFAGVLAGIMAYLGD